MEAKINYYMFTNQSDKYFETVDFLLILILRRKIYQDLKTL